MLLAMRIVVSCVPCLFLYVLAPFLESELASQPSRQVLRSFHQIRSLAESVILKVEWPFEAWLEFQFFPSGSSFGGRVVERELNDYSITKEDHSGNSSLLGGFLCPFLGLFCLFHPCVQWPAGRSLSQ